jgi:hypothetical protein
MNDKFDPPPPLYLPNLIVALTIANVGLFGALATPSFVLAATSLG